MSQATILLIIHMTWSTYSTKIPENVFTCLARVESNLNSQAISEKNAIGLFQIMPRTGRWLGFSKEDLLDPVLNARAAIMYLEILRSRMGLEQTLTHYNRGYKPGNNRFVRKVLRCSKVGERN